MGKKGLSTHHRLIGGKLCLLLHHLYQISIELLQCVRASTGLSTNGFSPALERDPFALSVAKRSRRVDDNTRKGPFQKRIDISLMSMSRPGARAVRAAGRETQGAAASPSPTAAGGLVARGRRARGAESRGVALWRAQCPGSRGPAWHPPAGGVRGRFDDGHRGCF